MPIPWALGQANDTASRPGLLIRGPLERRGIPLGSTNAVPCRYGLYRWGGQDFEVFLVDVSLEMGENWSPLEWGNLRLFKRKIGDGVVFYYSDSRGWAIFITAFGTSEEDLTLFAEKFVDRFTYFRAISKGLSFPAVLEIEKGTD